MKTRADFLKRLHEDEAYKGALAGARSDAERARVAQVVEGFVGSFADILGPLIVRAQQDPEFAKQLAKALSEGQRVVTGEQSTSGSIGR